MISSGFQWTVKSCQPLPLGLLRLLSRSCRASWDSPTFISISLDIGYQPADSKLATMSHPRRVSIWLEFCAHSVMALTNRMGTHLTQHWPPRCSTHLQTHLCQVLVAQYVHWSCQVRSSCSMCAMTKAPHTLPHNWSHTSIDFPRDLPCSQGYGVIFVIIDWFSKFLCLMPLRG